MYLFSILDRLALLYLQCPVGHSNTDYVSQGDDAVVCKQHLMILQEVCKIYPNWELIPQTLIWLIFAS